MLLYLLESCLTYVKSIILIIEFKSLKYSLIIFIVFFEGHKLYRSYFQKHTFAHISLLEN